MPLRVALLRTPRLEITWHEKRSAQLWKLYHRPPLHLILLLVEFLIGIFYCFSVLIPTQYDAYQYRETFKSIFFLENHESPISRSSDLVDYYLDLNQSALRMQSDFLMNVSFPVPMSHEITYANGTKDEFYSMLDFDPEDLKDIVTILTKLVLYVFNNDHKSCSKWTVQITVSDIYSNPAFWLSSVIYRDHCPKSLVSNQSQILYVRRTFQFIPRLMLVALIHLIIVLYQLVIRWRLHKNWRRNDADYHDLKSGQMFHYTIGIWRVFELISCVSVLSGCVYVLVDSIMMTELAGLGAVQVFALTTVILNLCMLQFFKFNVYTYHFVAILAEGCVQLFDIAIGFTPVICAFFLAGIFIFSHIAPKTRSVFSMLEILVSFTLGDNIEPTYNEFSDGTPLFNWIAFIYITLLVLAAGWVVFASFTATIAFVDQKLLMKKAKVM